MNFNFDYLSLIEYFTGAFICCLTNVMVGKILLKSKTKYNCIFTFLIVCILACITLSYSLALDNIIKVFMSIIIMFCNYYFIFGKKSIDSFIYGIITYIIFIIGESLTISIIMLLNKFFSIDLIHLLSKSIIANIFIGIICSIVALIIRNKLNVYIKKLNNNRIFLILLQAVAVIFVSIAAINYLYISHWKFSYEFVLSIIIILGSLFLIHSLLKQQIKNKEIIDKYSLLEEYMKTSADLVEKYSSTVHKYKNNLIAIKGYYKKSFNDGEKYVDKLLEGYQNKKYNWFSKINYIKFDSIRYLIYYKLSKAEELNLKLVVDVSKDINTFDSNLLDMNKMSVILEIIGELFDNAIYASNESLEKELIFISRIENKKLIFEIANTFLRNINLNLIYKNGYTTKGKGHGLGLYDIDKRIKDNNYLEKEIYIQNNYFNAKLIIDIK